VATEQSLPAAFDETQETNKFLAGVKKKASAKFSRKKAASVENAVRLAYWLLVFDKQDAVLEVCRFLNTYEFAGNFSLWSWIEFSLALQSRIVRQRELWDEAVECVQRIRAPWFVPARLSGGLLDLERIKSAVAEGNTVSERDWSLLTLLELCVLIELGGSETWPVAALEREFQQILTRLRSIMKAS